MPILSMEYFVVARNRRDSLLDQPIWRQGVAGIRKRSLEADADV